MASLATPLTRLILEQLARAEMRQLTLVVAIRKVLGPADRIKGDLSAMVKSALRQLLTAQAIVESDGMFSINPRQVKSLSPVSIL